MVYKAVQAYLADKAQSFLPGNTFYPEEDKYASQFDPWSIGHRPVTRSWINISVNIQIGFAAQDTVQADPSRKYNSTESRIPSANSTEPTPNLRSHFDTGSQESNSSLLQQRGGRQTTFERILGHTYGGSTVKGGMNHFGDVHYHYTQMQAQAQAQAHVQAQTARIARRHSDSITGISRPSLSNSMQESSNRNAACNTR